MYPPAPYPLVVSHQEHLHSDERLVDSSPYVLNVDETAFLAAAKAPQHLVISESSDSVHDKRDPLKYYIETDESEDSPGDSSFDSADLDAQGRDSARASPTTMLPNVANMSSSSMNALNYSQVRTKNFHPDPAQSNSAKRSREEEETSQETPLPKKLAVQVQSSQASSTSSQPQTQASVEPTKQIFPTKTPGQKTLSQPFRSPLLSKKPIVSAQSQTTPASSSSRSLMPSTSLSATSSSFTLATTSKPQIHRSSLIRSNTKAASKPFKSPLVSKSTATSGGVSGSRNTGISSIDEKKNIQTLEKKLLILKQARKYRLDGSTETLQALADKWKKAAQEAAQELWSLVQAGISVGGVETSEASSSSKGKGKGADDGGFGSWGYNDKDDDVLAFLKDGSGKRRDAGFESSWGWDDSPSKNEHTNEGEELEAIDEVEEPTSPTTLARQIGIGHSKSRKQGTADDGDDYYDKYGRFAPATASNAAWAPRSNAGEDLDSRNHATNEDDEEEEKEPIRNNIGAMLTQLGIPKEMLGWDDESEDFA